MIKLNQLGLRPEHFKSILSKMKKYHKNYGIFFHILKDDGENLELVVSQFNPFTNKIFDANELKEIGLDTFDSIKESRTLKIMVTTVEPSPIRVVNLEWFKKNLYTSGTKLKTVKKELPIQKEIFEDFLEGKANLNIIEKAAIYYYFQYKNLKKKALETLEDINVDDSI